MLTQRARWPLTASALMSGVCAASLWAVAWAVLRLHPWWSPGWMVVCAGLALLAWMRPYVGFALLLGLLPVASLSVWSGWRVTDEFDVFLLLILGGGYAHEAWALTHNAPQASSVSTAGRFGFWRAMPPSLRWAWLGVLCMWAVSAWRGWVDAGAVAPDLLFDDEGSAGNVWRVAKSMVALIAVAPWLHALYRRSSADAVRSLHIGMLGGLVVVCALAVWERAVYIGLWDLRSDYRTTAWFWEMHLGGGAIDVYLALSAPMAWWALWRARTAWSWAGAAFLLVVLVYVVVTTYSRGLAGVFVLGSAGMWFMRRRLQPDAVGAVSWRGRAQRWLLAALVAEAILLVGAGRFAADRLSNTSVDVQSRWAHWQSMLGLLADPSDWWLGIGQGRLPVRHSALSSGPPLPGHWVWSTKPGPPALQLHGPASAPELEGRFSLARRVPLGAGQHVVHLTVRADQATRLRFSLCERHLLYDIRCQEVEGVVPAGEAHEWAWPLSGPELGEGGWLSRQREGMALLSVTQSGRAVDILSWDIRNAADSAFLQHADFSRGLTGWYFVSSGYFRPWHADNLWMELWVERGLLGSLTYLILLACVLWRVYGRCFTGETWMAPILAGLMSASVLFCVISVTELPRLSFLWGSLLLTSSFWGGVLHDRSP